MQKFYVNGQEVSPEELYAAQDKQIEEFWNIWREKEKAFDCAYAIITTDATGQPCAICSIDNERLENVFKCQGECPGYTQSNFSVIGEENGEYDTN